MDNVIHNLSTILLTKLINVNQHWNVREWLFITGRGVGKFRPALRKKKLQSPLLSPAKSAKGSLHCPNDLKMINLHPNKASASVYFYLSHPLNNEWPLPYQQHERLVTSNFAWAATWVRDCSMGDDVIGSLNPTWRMQGSFWCGKAGFKAASGPPKGACQWLS